MLECVRGDDEMVDLDAKQTERLVRALESIAESLQVLSSCVTVVNPQNPVLKTYDVGQSGR